MNKNPFFTIVTASYNRAYIIEKPIRSVLNQSFGDFEHIIVDDGSTDNTEKVVKSFNDGRLVYIKLPQSSGGPCKPRNVGLGAARGQYVIILDSDDQLDKDTLTVYKEWIEKRPEMKVFLMDTMNEDEGKMRSGSLKDIVDPNKATIFEYKDVLCGGFTGDYLFCFKNEIVKKIKYPEGFKRNYNYLYKVSKEYDFFYIPKVGLYITAHRTTGNDRLTRTIEKNAEYFIEWVDDYVRLFKEDTLKVCPQYMERWYREKGVLNVLAGKRKEGLVWLLKGLKYKPFSYKSWFYIIFSILAPWAVRQRARRMF